MLRLDRDMDELFVLPQQLAVFIGTFRFMRDDGNNRGKFSNADLPDMKISHDGIAVALHRLANFLG